MSKYYHVIGRSTIENTNKVIKELTEEGWKTTGNIEINPHPSVVLGAYMQALVKTDLMEQNANTENLYRIIGRSEIHNLESVVDEIIEMGLLPTGGIKINPSPNLVLGTYTQTMSSKVILDLETSQAEEKRTVGRPTIQNLETVVVELMQMGWIPIGGMEINPKQSLELGHFIQKLIKLKK